MKLMLLTFAALSAAFAQQAPAAPAAAPQPSAPPAAAKPSAEDRQILASYVLGPDDEVTIRVLAVDEIGGDKPIHIDTSGYIRLPLAGRVKLAGLTVVQAEEAIAAKLRAYVLHPEVTVSVAEFRSQPVSVLGAVKNPGVYQLRGRKTLYEVLSLAGGLDQTAGSSVRLTRNLKWGRIPLENAADDPRGGFSTAEVDLKSILNASNPRANIVLRPDDVVSVPRAEIVYVVGQVMKAGGFELRDKKQMSVLEALSLAGGLDRGASAKNARILRPAPGASERQEIKVNLASILNGKGPDQMLGPDDILFVPSNVPKKAALRAIEAAIQTASGVVIWRGSRY